MESLGSMDLDEETYKDIIDKIGADINEILKGMKNDKEMKQKFIHELYKKDVEEDRSDMDDELAQI